MNWYCGTNTSALSTLLIVNSFVLLFSSGMLFVFFNASYVVSLVPCLFWICVDVDVVYKICPGARFGFSDYCFRFVSLDSIFFYIFICVSFFNFLESYFSLFDGCY